VEVRQQLLDAVYGGKPFRAVLTNLDLTSNQVWGLTKTDREWAAALDAALTATRRVDLRLKPKFQPPQPATAYQRRWPGRPVLRAS
jgi:hypothetical protein